MLYTFNFAFAATIFISLKGGSVSRMVSKKTNEKKVEWLKTKIRNYALRVVVQFLSVFHCGHATGDRLELDIHTFCTTSSDPASDFKAGRMKSWKSPLAWEIFARDKVSVEIPVSFPGSKSISSYMRGETILAYSKMQSLEQTYLLHLQQRSDFSTSLPWIETRPLSSLFSSTHAPSHRSHACRIWGH